MVLIIKKVPLGKRHDVILIPKRPLFDMLEKHVARKGLAKGKPNTCIVTSKDGWTGKPNLNLVVAMIMETLKHQRVLEGENRYPLPSTPFFTYNLKCREFDWKRMPIAREFRGDFVFNVQIISDKNKEIVINELQSYEKFGMVERLKIRHIFKEIENAGGNCLFYLVKRIYTEKRR